MIVSYETDVPTACCPGSHAYRVYLDEKKAFGVEQINRVTNGVGKIGLKKLIGFCGHIMDMMIGCGRDCCGIKCIRINDGDLSIEYFFLPFSPEYYV